MGKFLRIRVNIDISQPLKRGIRVSLDDSEETIMLLIRYERLPEYCFGCGMVGHHVRDCPSAPTDADFVQADNQPFGPWLRASSLGMSRPARGTTATAGPVNPVGNTASLREQTLEAAMATGSRAVGVQVRSMRAGDGSLRDTAGSRTNSAMQIPAMASRVVAAGGAHAAPMGAGKGGRCCCRCCPRAHGS
ncbi:hypothetical protein ACOSP7_008436 [Xanthoceras sorbifolium]